MYKHVFNINLAICANAKKKLKKTPSQYIQKKEEIHVKPKRRKKVGIKQYFGRETNLQCTFWIGNFMFLSLPSILDQKKGLDNIPIMFC